MYILDTPEQLCTWTAEAVTMHNLSVSSQIKFQHREETWPGNLAHIYRATGDCYLLRKGGSVFFENVVLVSYILLQWKGTHLRIFVRHRLISMGLKTGHRVIDGEGDLRRDVRGGDYNQNTLYKNLK